MYKTLLCSSVFCGLIVVLLSGPLFATEVSSEPSAQRLVILGCDPSPAGYVVNLAQSNVHPRRLDADDAEVDRTANDRPRCLPALARLTRFSFQSPNVAVARLSASVTGVMPEPNQVLVWEGRRHGTLRMILGCAVGEDGQLVVRFSSRLGSRYSDLGAAGDRCLDVLTALDARHLNVSGPVALAAGRNADGSQIGRGLLWTLTGSGLAKLLTCNTNDAGGLETTYVERSDERYPDTRRVGTPCLQALAAEQRGEDVPLRLTAVTPVPQETEECLIFDLSVGGDTAPCCACAPVCACGLCP